MSRTRTVMAIAAVASIGIAAAPLASAWAADPPAPVFSSSMFSFNGDTLPFSDVAARPAHAVQLPSAVAIKFSGSVKLVQAGNGVTVQDTNAPKPYFADPATPDTHLDGTAALDPNDDTVVVVTPPASLPDATYELHVTAFDKANCADATIIDVTPPACAKYDGLVNDDSAQPFTFTIDTAGPTIAFNAIHGGTPMNATQAESVSISGTATSDTKSMKLSVTSSGGGTSLLLTNPTVVAHNGQPSTWSVTGQDLSSVKDGTLTFTAIGTDFAGNKTDPSSNGAKATAKLASHPSAPRSFTVKAGDASLRLSWLPPASTGGHPIIGYSFAAIDTTTNGSPVKRSITCSGTCPSTYTFKGLTNGHAYTVGIAAANDHGPGAVALGKGHPKAGTTLTVKRSAKSVVSGHKVTLHGRLSTTKTGSAVAGVYLVVTPHFSNGTVGTSRKVKTDLFGVYSISFKPTKSARYVVHWVGDKNTLAATGSTTVAVTPSLPRTG